MRHLRFMYLTAGAAAVLLTGCSAGVDDNPAQGPAPDIRVSKPAGGADKPTGRGEGSKKTDIVLAADPAPEFEVETFDGGTFSIREQLGTPVVLNFWESW